jgi:enoyl-CoA hydratase/carnithine racemase
MTSRLDTSQHGPVTVLKLSRAAKRNAFNREMIEGLETFFRSPPEGTRAIVLHGEGNHFCAGLDLSTITGTIPAAGIHNSRALTLAPDTRGQP